jgi:hypothetical protein
MEKVGFAGEHDHLSNLLVYTEPNKIIISCCEGEREKFSKMTTGSHELCLGHTRFGQVIAWSLTHSVH